MVCHRIRFFALIPRAPNVTPQTFHDHWRHPHGTWARQIATLREYVQSHQITTPHLGDEQTVFEGVAEAAFETLDEAKSFGEHPHYLKHVKPDEPNFIDMDRLCWLHTDEEVLMARARADDGASEADAAWHGLDRSITVKLIQLIHHDGDAQWFGDDDAELGRRVGCLRHARNYPLLEIHGHHAPFRGVRQLWWPTLSAFEQGVRTQPAAFSRLLRGGGKATTLLAQAERFLP